MDHLFSSAESWISCNRKLRIRLPSQEVHIQFIPYRYNRRKRLESFIKSLYYGKRQASCVAPRLYGNRLVDFIRENLSGKPSIGSEKINH